MPVVRGGMPRPHGLASASELQPRPVLIHLKHGRQRDPHPRHCAGGVAVRHQDPPAADPAASQEDQAFRFPGRCPGGTVATSTLCIPRIRAPCGRGKCHMPRTSLSLCGSRMPIGARDCGDRMAVTGVHLLTRALFTFSGGSRGGRGGCGPGGRPALIPATQRHASRAGGSQLLRPRVVCALRQSHPFPGGVARRLGNVGRCRAAGRLRFGAGCMATSTLFWTVSHAFTSSAPPHTRRALLCL